MQTNHSTEERIVFSGQEYLRKYFIDNLTPKNKEVIRFHSEVYKDLSHPSLLEFGGGPTIYTLLNAAASVDQIHFTDYSTLCLDEVQNWVNAEEQAFDWSTYTKYALQLEQGEQAEISKVTIEERHTLLRERIIRISGCDVWEDDLLLGNSMAPYGVVSTNFCLEATTSNKKDWFHFNEKLAKLIALEGHFVTTALWNTHHYSHQGVQHACVHLQPEDLSEMYKALGFKMLHLETVNAEEGFDYIFAFGQKIK